MKNKLSSLLLVGVMIFSSVPSILAHDGEEHGPYALNINEAEIKDKLREKVEVRTDAVKAKVEQLKNSRAELKNVKVTAKTTTTLTVEHEGKNVTVNLSDNTHLKRKFGGNSDVEEFSVGNTVNIVGKWTDDTKTAVNAVLIRNESIQKRNGVFFGTVKSLTSGGFVLTTLKREDQTVTLGSAKLVNRKGEAITDSDIKVGDKVRVRGLWDSSLKTITEVKEVKNLSLPPFSRSSNAKESPVTSPTP